MWFGRLLTAVPKSVEPRTVLGLNSSGEEVMMLQARLRRLGFYDREPSGRFDQYTRNQVRLFQRQHRIKIDGLVGLETNLVLFSQLAGQDAPRLSARFQQGKENRPASVEVGQ
jgi:peptidoglycan hydrolase-like protein with peptidoglycan-binding domain